MKKFGKHSKSLVALLLAIVMLFGTLLPVAAAATELEPSSTGEAGGNAGSGYLDAGWCQISYDKNGIKVTLHPSKDALLGVNKDQLVSILTTFSDAAKAVIVEQIKEQLLGNEPSAQAGFNVEDLLVGALDEYINEEYGELTTKEEKYMEFFGDVMDESEDNETVDGLITYICDTIKGFGVSYDMLPEPDSIKNSVNAKFNEFLTNFIEESTNSAVNAYIDAIKNNKPHGENVLEQFVADHITEFLHSSVILYVEHMTGGQGATGTLDKYIDDYIHAHILDFAHTYIDAYIKHLAENPGYVVPDDAPEAERYIDEFVSDYISTYVDQVIDECVAYYVATIFGETDSVTKPKDSIWEYAKLQVIDPAVDDYIQSCLTAYKKHFLNPEEVSFAYPAAIKNILDGKVNSFIDARIDNYITAKKAGKPVSTIADYTSYKEIYDLIDSAVFEYFKTSVDNTISDETDRIIKEKIVEKNGEIKKTLIDELTAAADSELAKLKENAKKALADTADERIAQLKADAITELKSIASGKIDELLADAKANIKTTALGQLPDLKDDAKNTIKTAVDNELADLRAQAVSTIIGKVDARVADLKSQIEASAKAKAESDLKASLPGGEANPTYQQLLNEAYAEIEAGALEITSDDISSDVAAQLSKIGITVDSAITISDLLAKIRTNVTSMANAGTLEIGDAELPTDVADKLREIGVTQSSDDTVNSLFEKITNNLYTKIDNGTLEIGSYSIPTDVQKKLSELGVSLVSTDTVNSLFAKIESAINEQVTSGVLKIGGYTLPTDVKDKLDELHIEVDETTTINSLFADIRVKTDAKIGAGDIGVNNADIPDDIKSILNDFNITFADGTLLSELFAIADDKLTSAKDEIANGTVEIKTADITDDISAKLTQYGVVIEGDKITLNALFDKIDKAIVDHISNRTLPVDENDIPENITDKLEEEGITLTLPDNAKLSDLIAEIDRILSADNSDTVNRIKASDEFKTAFNKELTDRGITHTDGVIDYAATFANGELFTEYFDSYVKSQINKDKGTPINEITDADVTAYVRDKAISKLREDPTSSLNKLNSFTMLTSDVIAEVGKDKANKPLIEDIIADKKTLTEEQKKQVVSKALASLPKDENGNYDISGFVTDDQIVAEMDKLLKDTEHADTFKAIVEDFFGKIEENQEQLEDMVAEIAKEFSPETIQEIVDAITGNDDLVGLALNALFGLGSKDDPASAVAALNNRVQSIVENDLIPAYTELREQLKKEPVDIDFEMLFKALRTISIRDNKADTPEWLPIFENASVVKESFKTLLKNLPTISDLAEMPREDMYLSYGVSVDAELLGIECGVAFDLTVEMSKDCDDCTDADFERFNTAARIIAEHLDISFNRQTGKLSVSVTVPKLFADAVLKAINSGRIPDSLKKKVFAQFDNDVDHYYTFFGNLTFDEIITLLENVNFEGVINKVENNGKVDVDRIINVLKPYVDLTGYENLTNEQIIEKAKTFEDRFNKLYSKAADYAERLYNKLPDQYKSYTVMELYEGSEGGNGYFGFERDFAVTEQMYNKAVAALLERIPDKYQYVAVYVLGLIDFNGFSGSLDLNVEIPDVAKITYVVGGETVGYGLLPEGASINFFAPITSYAGVAINNWVVENESGEFVTADKMPSADTVVYAQLDANVVVNVDDLTFVYDGTDHYLVPNIVETPIGSLDSSAVTVEWYKGASVAGGEYLTTADKYAVQHVSDSGAYSVKVIVTDAYGYSESFLYENISVEITRPTVSAIVVDKDGNEITNVSADYSGDSHVLKALVSGNALATSTSYQWYYKADENSQATAISGAITDSVSVTNNSDNGYYYCVVTTVIDGIEDSVTTGVVGVNIAKIVISTSDVFSVADGYVILKPTVAIDVRNSEIADLFTFNGTYSTSEPGSYTVTATLKDTDNYVLSDLTVSKEITYHIVPEISVDTNATNGAFEFTYDGTEHTLTVTVSGNSATSAVTYTWYRYNTETAEFEQITVTTDSLALKNVVDSGKYKVVVSVTDRGYEYEDVELVVDVTVSPIEINVDDFTWSDLADLYYNGEEQTVTPSVTLPDGVDNVEVTFSGDLTVKKPGSYSVIASISIVDADSNYVLTASDKTITFSVLKPTFKYSDITWNASSFDYSEGVVHKVYLEGYESFTFGDVVVVYAANSVNEASEAGTYTAIFEAFKVQDGDELYPLSDYYTVDAANAGFRAELEWSIKAPAPILPDIFEETVEGGGTVKIEDASGTLKNYTMSITKADVGEFVYCPNNEKYKVVIAYNITFADADGASPDYDGVTKYKVLLEVPSGIDTDSLFVMFVADEGSDNELFEELSIVEEGGKEYAQFETTHFSAYALVIPHVEPEHQHSLTYYPANAPSCDSAGNIAYWYCSGCQKFFSDENGQNEVTEEDIKLDKLEHSYVDGFCEHCGEPEPSEPPIIPPEHVHTITAVPAKDATCTEVGNTAYWYCSECGKYYSDPLYVTETTLEATVLPKIPHNYVDGVCSACGAADPNAPTEPPEDPDKINLDSIIVLIIGIVLLILALWILFVLLRKLKRRRRVKKDAFLNEYDETVEIYEDLEKMEWHGPTEVFIDGDLPEDIHIEETVDELPSRKSNVTVTQIPESLDKDSVPVIIETDDERADMRHKFNPYKMKPNVKEPVAPAPVEPTPAPVAAAPKIKATAISTVPTRKTASTLAALGGVDIVAEAPIVPKRPDVQKSAPTPVLNKISASKHYEVAVPEAPLTTRVEPEIVVAPTPAPAPAPVVKKTVKPSPIVDIRIPTTLTPKTVKENASVFFTVEKAEKPEPIVEVVEEPIVEVVTQPTIEVVPEVVEVVEEPVVEEVVEEPVVEEVVEEPVVEEAIEEPAVEKAIEEPVVEEVVEEPVVEEAIEEPVVEEAIEEPVVEEAIEEPVVEEPIEEPVVEEVIEEPVVEETIEEPVVEEPIEEIIEGPIVFTASGDGDGDGTMIINGRIVHVRYRSSFTSRLIQASESLQDYYTLVKNALLSYKGVKARTSWNCESFNKGRTQCAKVNIKGKTLVVYLALDPNEYVDSKYHFKDVSNKPKFAKVPMMLRIRSARSLKYCIELIEQMMEKLGIQLGNIADVDYHVPYETTEALVARNLVKLILPKGIIIDENANVVKMNVTELLASAKSDAPAPAEVIETVTVVPVEPTAEPVEAVAEEPVPEVVEEPVVEEVVEEPVVEEVVEEPVVEEVVEEPVVEEVVEEPVVEEVVEEPVVEEVVEEPVVEEVVEEPVVEEVVEEPVVEEVVEEPVVEEVVEEPVVEEVVEEPVVEEVVEEPVVEEVVEEPVVEEVVEEPVVEEVVEEPVVEEVVEEPVVEEVVEEFVHVDAIEADELVTDEEAEQSIEIVDAEDVAVITSTKRVGKMAEINLDTICDNFEDDETVTLEALKAKRLIKSNCGRVKILARGIMTKKLVIIADKFSLQAVKMIILAGGHAEQLK